jgi:hypothetical protein
MRVIITEIGPLDDWAHPPYNMPAGLMGERVPISKGAHIRKLSAIEMKGGWRRLMLIPDRLCFEMLLGMSIEGVKIPIKFAQVKYKKIK